MIDAMKPIVDLPGIRLSMTDNAASFLEFLRRNHVLESAQIEQLSSDSPEGMLDAKAVTLELARRGWLTSYQAKLLQSKRSDELLLGSYVILESLGEGGMGQVFKARNWKLNRIVAIKCIHPDRLSGADAIR